MTAERPIDAVIDHAAALQQQVDALSHEVYLLALASLFLALGLMILGARLWHDRAR